MPLSNIKLLLLNVNRKGWHSGNMIYDMEAVRRACDTKIYGPGWPGYDTTDLPTIIKKLYGDDKPDVIYSYFTPNEKVGDVYVQRYNIPESLRFFPTNFKEINSSTKIFALSDFWARHPSKFSKDLTNSTFEYCFCCFTPPLSNPKHFYSFFDDNIRKQIKFIPYPRCVDKECYKDYNIDKKYDVVTLGAMWGFYPLRTFIHHYLQKNHDKLGIKYKNYPHCGVNFSHSDFVREKYAKAISESKILVSCGGRYGLAYNKIFEAWGCRTAYAGETPYGEKELHMKDGFNYIAINKDNFINRLQYYLNHNAELEKISNNGQETFLKYHHIDARANDFLNLLKSIS